MKKRYEWTLNKVQWMIVRKQPWKWKIKKRFFKGQRKVIEMVFRQRRTNLGIIAVSGGGKTELILKSVI